MRQHTLFVKVSQCCIEVWANKSTLAARSGQWQRIHIHDHWHVVGRRWQIAQDERAMDLSGVGSCDQEEVFECRILGIP
jgi:hypothetical protein